MHYNLIVINEQGASHEICGMKTKAEVRNEIRGWFDGRKLKARVYRVDDNNQECIFNGNALSFR
jgi:hypothetical protein